MRNYANSWLLVEMNGGGGGFLKKNSRDSREICFIFSFFFIRFLIVLEGRILDRVNFVDFSHFFFFFFSSINFSRVVSFVSFARDEVGAWSYGNVGQEVARWRRRQCMPLVAVDRDITTAGNVSIHRVGSSRYLQSRFIAPDVSHPRVSYITPCVKCVGITFRNGKHISLIL